MKKRILVDAMVLIAIMAIVIYVVARTVIFGYASYSGFDKAAGLFLLLSELFVILHGVGYLLNIYRAYGEKQRLEILNELAHNKMSKEPPVAILVAARHEPRSVLEDTFQSIRALKYRNKQIFFLDDSSDHSFRKEAEEISEKYGLRLFRRDIRHGNKAGIINDCLDILDHKYVVLFDSDQCPLPEFLNRVIPIMENDPGLAFVQTPQFYWNTARNRVARAAGFQQAVFYEFICEGKSSREAMFCCGTNIIFRRDALAEAGGFDEATVTEDFATSLKLHRLGWRSMYYNHTQVYGMAPENLSAYFKQQYRWANGTLAVFKKVLAGMISNPFSLKLGQWWEYFLSGSYYLIGLAFLVLIFFPVLFILFRIPSFFVRPEIYLLTFLPYIMLTMTVFYTVLGGRNYRPLEIFKGQLLGSVALTVYARSVLTSFLGVKTVFGVTEKVKGRTVPYYRLWPQLSILCINYFAFVWGLNRFAYEREAAILVNCFWAGYHCLVLSSVFYFNSAGADASVCKYPAKGVSFEYKVIKKTPGHEWIKSDQSGMCFYAWAHEPLDPGVFVMCKMRKKVSGDIIFEGQVIHTSLKKTRRGHLCRISVTTMLPKDVEKFEKEMLK